MRISVRKDTPICKDFRKFMRNDTNKTELFKMITEVLIQIPETMATIVATIGSKIVSNSSLEKLNIELCNHEEADTRLLLHVLHEADLGIKKSLHNNCWHGCCGFCTAAFFYFESLELWIEFGVDKYRRYIPTHTCAETFGRKLCSSLSLWHALTGCIQFQASTGKETRLLGKYCDYLMKDWLHLQGNFFLKYFTSPFRRKQLFVSNVLKVNLCSQAWLSAKPCAWFKFVASYRFYYFM